MILLSALLLIAGLITLPLPLPIGLPLLLIGLALLARHSTDAKRLLVKLSRRYPRLRYLLAKREKRHFSEATEDNIE
ncbi:MAG: PGPGW domain-containing protein [Pseudomonadota bacterium]